MALNRLLDGDDKAREEGFPNYRLRLRKFSSLKFRWSGVTGESAAPVVARVDFGRWVADCECGGAEYVTPTDPIFFCFSCGNILFDGVARPVTFPTPGDRAKIELALMARGVIEPSDDVPDTQIAMRSIANIQGVVRSWNPGETIETLHLQEAYANLNRGRS